MSSQHTLPFLFINLGGEMLYILDQRLRAQNVLPDKAKKVLTDIAGIMFNQRFLDELFKPQDVYNKGALRSLFHDLAHSSIMRLNEPSMSKLYDLMIMVYKYQIVTASQPKDLLLITLNHIDSVRRLVSNSAINKHLDQTYFQLIKTYSQMTSGELQRVRYTLLNFLQDLRVRVSILLRHGLQNNDGGFTVPISSEIPFGNEVPGSIRSYSKEGHVIDFSTFPPGGNYTPSPYPGSTELRGVRHTMLGTNIYSAEREGRGGGAEWEGGETYRRELNLLVTQLGVQAHPLTDIIRLNLFDTTDEQQTQTATAVSEGEPKAASSSHSEALNKILTEMHLQPQQQDVLQPNLLQLMDELV